MASIFVVSGKARGSYWTLEEDDKTLGRDEDCDYQIVDEMVSRHHMKLRYDQQARTYHVEDLQSANGVFVNGRRLQGEAELKDLDKIRIGDSELLYSVNNISDLDTALAFIKKRGEHGKSTLIK